VEDFTGSKPQDFGHDQEKPRGFVPGRGDNPVARGRWAPSAAPLRKRENASNKKPYFRSARQVRKGAAVKRRIFVRGFRPKRLAQEWGKKRGTALSCKKGRGSASQVGQPDQLEGFARSGRDVDFPESKKRKKILAGLAAPSWIVSLPEKKDTGLRRSKGERKGDAKVKNTVLAYQSSETSSRKANQPIRKIREAKKCRFLLGGEKKTTVMSRKGGNDLVG